MTALVLLVSGVYEPQKYLMQLQTGQAVTDGTTLTGMAFDTVLPWREFLAVDSALCISQPFWAGLIWRADSRVSGKKEGGSVVPSGLYSAHPSRLYAGSSDDLGFI